MEVPEVRRCFGMFPVRYATYMISILALVLGSLGLGAIIIYALARELIIKHFTGSLSTDALSQKITVLAIGLSSLFLFFSGIMLFVGVTFKQEAALAGGVWVLTAMCGVLLFVSMAIPILCYNDASYCILNRLPLSAIILVYTLVTLYLQVWFYFMVVAHNCLNDM